MVGRIAHLSDVHMLETPPSESRLYNLTLKLLSVGRVLDPQGRIRKLKAALFAAKKSGADHFVISGDLTEVGSVPQFEAFAEHLHESGIDPEKVTLVPGNHDAYSAPDGWARAMDGPLRAFAGGSAAEPGKVVDRGNVVFLPLDLSRHQSIVRSGGELTASAATALEQRLSDDDLRRRTVVVVQHHPPFGHAGKAWQWIDGLCGHARMTGLLTESPPAALLHGHMHRLVDRIAELGGRSSVFGAPATVDDEEGTPRVRLYDIHEGALQPAGFCAG
jgi:3',5'-cyclic AMP phosphodiesterase CpdA